MWFNTWAFLWQFWLITLSTNFHVSIVQVLIFKQFLCFKEGKQCTTTFWFVYLERGAVQKLQMIKFNYSNYIICLIGNSYHEYPRHTYSVAWKYLQADIAKFMILIVRIVCYGIRTYNITWIIPISYTWFLEILHLPPPSHSTTRCPVDVESTVPSIFSLPSA